MNRIQELVDRAFLRWQRAELIAKKQNALMACSSNLACTVPLTKQKRAQIMDAFGKDYSVH